MQFSLVQSLDQMGRRGDVRDDPAEILFQSFLQETHVSSSGIGMNVHSLMLSIQHFLCRPRRRPQFMMPWRMFWRCCHGVRHARTMQVFLSWQLPEKVPVDPQGSWSCSALSFWSCALSRRHGEISLCAWFENLGPFFFAITKQGSCFTAVYSSMQ